MSGRNDKRQSDCLVAAKACAKRALSDSVSQKLLLSPPSCLVASHNTLRLLTICFNFSISLNCIFQFVSFALSLSLLLVPCFLPEALFPSCAGCNKIFISNKFYDGKVISLFAYTIFTVFLMSC